MDSSKEEDVIHIDQHQQKIEKLKDIVKKIKDDHKRVTKLIEEHHIKIENSKKNKNNLD